MPPPTASTDHAYQEMLTQQMKALQMQQESLASVAAMTHGGVAGGTQELLNLQAMVYHNPALLQQILWMNLQQQQQQQQRDQVSWRERGTAELSRTTQGFHD